MGPTELYLLRVGSSKCQVGDWAGKHIRLRSHGAGALALGGARGTDCKDGRVRDQRHLLVLVDGLHSHCESFALHHL